MVEASLTYLGRSVLAVVPARGGSKGVPLKNLRPLAGIPLIAHTGALIGSLPWVDRAVVSTDDRRVADAAVASGLDAPFLRPAELSSDLVGDVPVLAHALTEMEAHDGRRYDVIVMLQPTSPLRTAEHVTAAVRDLIEEGWDSVWTVSRTDPRYHPLKQLTIDERGVLDLFDERGRSIIARQQLGAVYHRNGAAYAMTRSCLVDQGSTKGARSGAVIVEERLVNIDTEADFAEAEAMLTKPERANSGS